MSDQKPGVLKSAHYADGGWNIEPHHEDDDGHEPFDGWYFIGAVSLSIAFIVGVGYGLSYFF